MWSGSMGAELNWCGLTHIFSLWHFCLLSHKSLSMTPESGERCEGIIHPLRELPINLAMRCDSTSVSSGWSTILGGTILYDIDGVFWDCNLEPLTHMNFETLPGSFIWVTVIFVSHTLGLLWCQICLHITWSFTCTFTGMPILGVWLTRPGNAGDCFIHIVYTAEVSCEVSYSHYIADLGMQLHQHLKA